MQRPPNQGLNTLLFLVIFLAVGGGLAIVYLTSPQSFDFSRFFNPPPSATSTAAATATTTSTLVPPSPTASPTITAVPPTRAPSATSSTTPAPTDTRAPTLTATATETRLALPLDVRAIAEVTGLVGTATARVRSQPNGSQVIAALPGGTVVQVLFGEALVDGIEWVEVRLAGGQTGWMARFLLTFLVERLGNTATSRPPSTSTLAPTQPPPTQAPGATQPPAATATAGAPPASATATTTSAPSPTMTPPDTATVTATLTPTAVLIPSRLGGHSAERLR